MQARDFMGNNARTEADHLKSVHMTSSSIVHNLCYVFTIYLQESGYFSKMKAFHHSTALLIFSKLTIRASAESRT